MMEPFISVSTQAKVQGNKTRMREERRSRPASLPLHSFVLAATCMLWPNLAVSNQLEWKSNRSDVVFALGFSDSRLEEKT
jgi:hypothetical protein